MNTMSSRWAVITLTAIVTVAIIANATPMPSGKVDSIPLLPAGTLLSSYAGYITVDPVAGANLFFWLFEAQDVDSATAPLIVWLNGGPGSSSMYGLFGENGPLALAEDGSTLQMRDVTWTSNYNVMYIDNPVGTGFSYTEQASGFVTNQVEVGQDLLSFMYQFYELYPQFQKVPLYITGESYAGKYVPAFSYAIHQANAAHAAYIASSPLEDGFVHVAGQHCSRSAAPFNLPNGQPFPLAGLSIGDGMMDPITQVPGYGDYLYGLSLIDQEQRDYMTEVENKIVGLIQQEQWIPAFRIFDPLMMSDEYPYPSYFTNVTGFTDYYNFDTPSYPNNPFEDYLNRADVKAALHVDPDYVYSSGNGTVEVYLLSDWMQSVAPWVVTLIENYPVLIYSGQNDIILNSVQCQAFLNQLSWSAGSQSNSSSPSSGSDAWQNSTRTIWKVKESDYDVAGYVKQQNSQTEANLPGLTYAIVREAGHLVPQDQPMRSFDLINRFIQKLPFSS